jgi:hypothetical protein
MIHSYGVIDNDDVIIYDLETDEEVLKVSLWN